MTTAPSIVRSTAGVVLVEFLFALIPVWVLFMCLVQLALIAHASLLVGHAADSAARSAAVVLPDDPGRYRGEPERQVKPGVIGWADTKELFIAVAAALGTGTFHRGGDIPAALQVTSAFKSLRGRVDGTVFGSRSNAIAVAAHVPLMPLAPMDFFDSDPSIDNSLASRSSLVKSLFYNPLAVEISYPGATGNSVSGDEATVQVEYAYRCSVPVARQIICGDSLSGARGGVAALLMGGRYRLLTRESTFRIQDAPYEYREER